MHADAKLYLVFEFLDVDLKRYMENGNKMGNPMSLDLVKVSGHLYVAHCLCLRPTRYLRRIWCVVDACRQSSARPNTSPPGYFHAVFHRSRDQLLYSLGYDGADVWPVFLLPKASIESPAFARAVYLKRSPEHSSGGV